MASTYSIDFSEPLKVGFEIPAGGFDGPGASTAAAHTSLRLHGRGALEWGEAVNEDLVRLTENFASASPPPLASTGQAWVELKLYRKGPSTWFRYDLAAEIWVELTGVTSTTGKPTSTGITPGTYRYDSGSNILWGYYDISTVGSKTYDWRERSYTEQVDDTLPLPAVKPIQSLKVFDAFATSAIPDSTVTSWVPPLAVTVSPTSEPPANPVTGTLWFDTLTNTLRVYDASLLPADPWRSLYSDGVAAGGTLDMSAFQIINLADPVVDSDAMTLGYANANYINASGDTMTGLLTLSGAPTSNLHAATKAYVDATVAGATAGDTAGVFNNPVGSIIYHAGDIAIAGGKIYIALTDGTSTVPGGAWKQVWPATYS